MKNKAAYLIKEIKGTLHDLEVEIQGCEYIGINEPEIQIVRNRIYDLDNLIARLENIIS